MKKDKNKIPKGMYCYCSGGCPYYEEIPHMKMDYNGFGNYMNVVRCNYLDKNTMSMAVEGDYWGAWLLYDSCKPCNINICGIYE